jgi:hypothetical protein
MEQSMMALHDRFRNTGAAGRKKQQGEIIGPADMPIVSTLTRSQVINGFNAKPFSLG